MKHPISLRTVVGTVLSLVGLAYVAVLMLMVQHGVKFIVAGLRGMPLHIPLSTVMMVAFAAGGICGRIVFCAGQRNAGRVPK